MSLQFLFSFSACPRQTSSIDQKERKQECISSGCRTEQHTVEGHRQSRRRATFGEKHLTYFSPIPLCSQPQLVLH